jgi:hypothetical protein
MAELILSTADIRLSARERNVISRSLEDMVQAESKRDLALHDARFARKDAFRKVLSAQLRKAGAVDVEALRDHVGRSHARLDANHLIEAKRRRQGRKGAVSRPRAVWGLTSGNETPTYDFNWTFHDVVGGNATGNFSHTADRATGRVHAYAHCHDSNPKKVDSYAGVGFWYIPNRVGVLSIGIAPALTELMWTGASWNDVAIAGGWISLGISSYLRDPFRFVEWRVIDTDQLWYNEDNWFDWTDHDRTRTASGMSVNTLVDTAHYYACWMWLRAYTYGQNGGSYAGSSLNANLPAFSYNLV